MLDERSWFVERREETHEERADAILVFSEVGFRMQDRRNPAIASPYLDALIKARFSSSTLP